MINRPIRRAVAAAVVLAAAVAWAAGGYAQTRTRSMFVRPDNQIDGVVGCSLRIERLAGAGGSGARIRVESGETVRIGERVVLCFSAEADGYVAVWSRDAEQNTPVRIYPNEYAASSANDLGAPVTAGREVCIGEGDGFHIEVGPPVGDAEVYLHFTRELSQQFDESAFPVVRATPNADSRPYASSHVRYTVTQ